ncbi:MAG: BatA and WFA domain-containing protein [Planctomycetes bacterium]|nr:BatA and WFA domain-containing protein [Planctomycetota bacterium]
MFAQPLGLLALFALPAIVALHLYRRRFEPRRVSALFLWQAVDRTPVAGRVRQPLRATASLAAELLAAALLAFALAGPRPGSTRSEHLVVVLDGSASMAARAGDATARVKAVREIERRLDALGADGRVSLVVSGPRPSVLVGPAAYVREAREALARYEPRATTHELTSAVALGLELSSKQRVVVLTDRFEPAEFPREVECVAVGAPESNFAFAHAVRTRERAPAAQSGSGSVGGPARGDDSSGGAGAPRSVERVFLTVVHRGGATGKTTLALFAGDQRLAEREIELAPGAKASFGFELPAGAPLVEARLGGDALELDDVARLAPVPPRVLTLASDLDPVTLARLFLSDPRGEPGNVDRWLELVPESRAAAELDAAHLALVAEPKGGAATSLVVLDRPTGDPHDWIGPFLIEKRHRAFEGVSLDGVVWSARDGEPLPGAPLVSAGNLPLLTEERLGSRTLWRLRLDPARATLARSADWPILLANLAEVRRAELPGLSRVNVGLGESVVYRAGAELQAARARALDYELRAPDGTPRSIPARAEFVLDELDRVGVWELALGETVLGRIAVTFVDPRESDLSTRSAGRRPAEAHADEPEVDFAWPEAVLVALALGLVLLDFFVLARGARRLATFTAPGARGAA